ncbi:hypothetical protein CDAR_611541 [Caerostris darwini]|uniref:Uncharacterized protein n=1 Tax=Caerostris darwini TaxID=1538125 RepID=A0AAV4U2P0_9ARAC|nr:hypothetical protein CDAR_611541 [Caerostris darwini]
MNGGWESCEGGRLKSIMKVLILLLWKLCHRFLRFNRLAKGVTSPPSEFSLSVAAAGFPSQIRPQWKISVCCFCACIVVVGSRVFPEKD